MNANAPKLDDRTPRNTRRTRMSASTSSLRNIMTIRPYHKQKDHRAERSQCYKPTSERAGTPPVFRSWKVDQTWVSTSKWLEIINNHQQNRHSDSKSVSNRRTNPSRHTTNIQKLKVGSNIHEHLQKHVEKSSTKFERSNATFMSQADERTSQETSQASRSWTSASNIHGYLLGYGEKSSSLNIQCNMSETGERMIHEISKISRSWTLVQTYVDTCGDMVGSHQQVRSSQRQSQNAVKTHGYPQRHNEKSSTSSKPTSTSQTGNRTSREITSIQKLESGWNTLVPTQTWWEIINELHQCRKPAIEWTERHHNYPEVGKRSKHMDTCTDVMRNHQQASLMSQTGDRTG